MITLKGPNNGDGFRPARTTQAAWLVSLALLACPSLAAAYYFSVSLPAYNRDRLSMDRERLQLDSDAEKIRGREKLQLDREAKREVAETDYAESPQGSEAPLIRAHRFQLIGASGETEAELRSGPGGPVLTLRNPVGGQTVRIEANKALTGFVAIGAPGDMTAGMTVSGHEAELSFSKSDPSHTYCRLGANADGESQLMLEKDGYGIPIGFPEPPAGVAGMLALNKIVGPALYLNNEHGQTAELRPH